MSTPVGTVPSLDSYPLRGLLYCTCGQPFYPWGWSEDARTYLSLCGCRMRPVDATTIEQRVQAQVAATTSTSLVGSDVCAAVSIRRVVDRIEVGGTIDDLRLLRHP